MYADDTNLMMAASSKDEIELKMNKDVENVRNWPYSNGLSLNTTKS